MQLKFDIGFICSVCKFKILHETLRIADRTPIYGQLAGICWNYIYNDNLDTEYKAPWLLTKHGAYYIQNLHKL